MHLFGFVDSWLPFAVFLGVESSLIKSLFVITHSNLYPPNLFFSPCPYLLLLGLASVWIIIK